MSQPPKTTSNPELAKTELTKVELANAEEQLSNDELRKSISKITAEKKQADAENIKQFNELAEAKAEIERLQKQIEGKDAAIRRRNREYDDLDEEKEELQKQVAQFYLDREERRGEMRELKQFAKETAEENNRLKQEKVDRTKEKNEQFKGFVDRLAEAETEREALLAEKEEWRQLAQSHEDMATQLSTVEERLNELNTVLDEHHQAGRDITPDEFRRFLQLANDNAHSGEEHSREGSPEATAQPGRGAQRDRQQSMTQEGVTDDQFQSPENQAAEEELAARAEDLGKREKDADVRARELLLREQGVRAREREVQRRQQAVQEREDEVERTHQSNLDEARRVQANVDSAVEGLKSHQKGLSAKSKLQDERQAKLDEREERLKRQSEEIRRRPTRSSGVQTDIVKPALPSTTVLLWSLVVFVLGLISFLAFTYEAYSERVERAIWLAANEESRLALLSLRDGALSVGGRAFAQLLFNAERLLGIEKGLSC
ncbi:hypothetical protein H2203_004983 [Taxawa tesnikishii (nom. ined.)]|nr:hypothetical protein H2203_004983 [Dothideales sp. JES 119]